MSKKTFNALLGRGIDLECANRLIDDGYTIKKMKVMTREELLNLGLSDEQAELFNNRPPVDDDVVNDLLYKSKYRCCVCRDSGKSIIIHHIHPWSESKDNSINNLAVLCLEHHDEAHTTHALSKNLTPDTILRFKEEWEDNATLEDANAIIGYWKENEGRWDYFNHRRIFELADRLNVDVTDNKYFHHLYSIHIVDENGLIRDPRQWVVSHKPKYQLYDCIEGNQLYAYMSGIICSVLSKLQVIDITNKWKKGEILSLIRPGNFIACEGRYYFRRNFTHGSVGLSQMVHGYRIKSGIVHEFDIDVWEATSTTARTGVLSGTSLVTPITLVRDILSKNGVLFIKSSCLCIGFNFRNPGRIIDNPRKMKGLDDLFEDETIFDDLF